MEAKEEEWKTTENRTEASEKDSVVWNSEVLFSHCVCGEGEWK